MSWSRIQLSTSNIARLSFDLQLISLATATEGSQRSRRGACWQVFISWLQSTGNLIDAVPLNKENAAPDCLHKSLTRSEDKCELKGCILIHPYIGWELYASGCKQR